VARPRPRAAAGAPQLAPGQLPRHYSPRTPVILHDRLADRPGAARAAGEACLFLVRPKWARGRNVFWLSARGDLRHVARRLFAVLRRIDGRGFRKIHAELAPGSGLAEAINDRLRRAAAR